MVSSPTERRKRVLETTPATFAELVLEGGELILVSSIALCMVASCPWSARRTESGRIEVCSEAGKMATTNRSGAVT